MLTRKPEAGRSNATAIKNNSFVYHIHRPTGKHAQLRRSQNAAVINNFPNSPTRLHSLPSAANRSALKINISGRARALFPSIAPKERSEYVRSCGISLITTQPIIACSGFDELKGAIPHCTNITYFQRHVIRRTMHNSYLK